MRRIVVALLIAFGSIISTASAYTARWYPLSDPSATEVERCDPKDIDLSEYYEHEDHGYNKVLRGLATYPDREEYYIWRGDNSWKTVFYQNSSECQKALESLGKDRWIELRDIPFPAVTCEAGFYTPASDFETVKRLNYGNARLSDLGDEVDIDYDILLGPKKDRFFRSWAACQAAAKAINGPAAAAAAAAKAREETEKRKLDPYR